MTFMEQYKVSGAIHLVLFIMMFIVLLYMIISDIFNFISNKKLCRREVLLNKSLIKRMILDNKAVVANYIFNKVIFISILFLAIDGWIDKTTIYQNYVAAELKTKEISIVSLESEWIRPPLSSRKSLGIETIYIHGSDGGKYFVQDMDWLYRDETIKEADEIGKSINIKYKELGGKELDRHQVISPYKIIEQITYN